MTQTLADELAALIAKRDGAPNYMVAAYWRRAIGELLAVHANDILTALRAKPAGEGVVEDVALLGELLDGPSKGKFYGIGAVLRNKLETIRLTALRTRPAAEGVREALSDAIFAAWEDAGSPSEWPGSDLLAKHLDPRLAALSADSNLHKTQIAPTASDTEFYNRDKWPDKDTSHAD